jgi:hypothetical protein
MASNGDAKAAFVAATSAKGEVCFGETQTTYIGP